MWMNNTLSFYITLYTFLFPFHVYFLYISTNKYYYEKYQLNLLRCSFVNDRLQ